MKCRFCGNEIRAGAKFCDECGTAIENSSGTINLSKENNTTPDASLQNTGMNNQQFGNQPQYNNQQFNGQPQYGNQQFGGQPQFSNQQFGYQQGIQTNQVGYYEQPGYTNKGFQVYNEGDGSPRYVGFVDAIKLFFRNYFNFSGRSTRSEYWYIFLIFCLVGVAFTFILVAEVLLDVPDSFGVATIAMMMGIGAAMLIPMYAVTVRRLHDAGQSGWMMLLLLIPLIGTVTIFVFTLMESQPNANQWGPVPNPNVIPYSNNPHNQ